MQRLVNDLLQYSRIGTQGREPAPADSGEVLTQVLTSMRDSIRESGVRICRDGLPVVEADDGQLARVFQNLIGNAVKFRSAENPQVHVGCERRGDEWLFSVADNGIGIDIEQSERVFQMFQRLHGRGEYDGSGIGLPIVRKIVERHGGRVWFESQPGQGTTFYFTLPARGHG